MCPNTKINPKVVDQEHWQKAPELLTAEIAASLLNISRSSMYLLFRQPGFPVVCAGKRRYVRKDDLYAWLQSYRNEEGASIE